MAISSSMVWECRATAANINNSGGFNPNNSSSNTTDYSQQDNPQYSFSDLASANGTNATPTVTSASHVFTTADVGNTMRITGGSNWTTGIYEITGISGSGAILDRACGTTLSLTGGLYVVGGSLDLAGSSTQLNMLQTAITAGNTVWIKSGSYNVGGNFATTSAGSVSSWINFEGYNITRGDSPTGNNRPTLNFISTGSLQAQTYTTVKNLIITNSTSVGQCLAFSISTNGGNCVASNCKLMNLLATNGTAGAYSNGGGVGGTATSHNLLINCEISNVRGPAIDMVNSATSGLVLINCYIHDSDNGIAFISSSSLRNIRAIGCIFEGHRLAAIDTTGASVGAGCLLVNNTFYGAENQTGIGFKFASNLTDRVKMYNNVFYGFSTAVSSSTANTLTTSDYNTFFNNGTNRTNWSAGASDVALNPTFKNVAQITGTTATITSGVLTQTGANFSNVVDNATYCVLTAGTGPTLGIYTITAHTTTTLTLSPTPSNGSSITFQVTTGKDLTTGSNMANLGLPSSFPATNTSSYPDIGATQLQYTDPGATNVKTGVTYTYANASQNGSLITGHRQPSRGLQNGKPKQSLS